MIGDLLKQLAIAVPKFVWYQVSRPFRRPRFEAAPPAISANESFQSLSDNAGLDSSYEALVPWNAYRSNEPSLELSSDPLYKLWASTSGGQKWSHYFWIYQAIFEPLRTRPLRVLEIGVLMGSSLRMWKQYFTHSDTVLVGIDIDPRCMHHDAPKEGIHVRIGSQDDPAFLKSVIAEFGKFDLIIDDGSHVSSHIIATFNHLYADGLQDDGIYFVEDLHANYWPSWRNSRKSFLDICKTLLEHMHGHYQRGSPGAFLVDKPSDQPANPLRVPLITTMIKEMRFFDSIVAIYKTKAAHIPYFLRGK